MMEQTVLRLESALFKLHPAAKDIYDAIGLIKCEYHNIRVTGSIPEVVFTKDKETIEFIIDALSKSAHPLTPREIKVLCAGHFGARFKSTKLSYALNKLFNNGLIERGYRGSAKNMSCYKLKTANNDL